MPSRAHPTLRATAIRFRKLLKIAGNRSYWPALRQGVAASVEHSGVPLRADAATVIDVGASRGQFALFASSTLPQAKIISFEPLPGPFDDLNRIVGDRVETHQSAVGSRSGTVSINISSRDDSSSLLPIGPRQVREFPGTGPAGTIEVTMVTLDEAIDGEPDRPCLLKIDVQGLELEVLKGAGRVLESVDEALIECSFIELYEGQALADEIVTVMRDAGFGLAGVHEVAYAADGSAIQGDFFFRRDTEEAS